MVLKSTPVVLVGIENMFGQNLEETSELRPEQEPMSITCAQVILMSIRLVQTSILTIVLIIVVKIHLEITTALLP